MKTKLENGHKLGVQFRNLKFKSETLKKDERTVELSISSDEPYERFFGSEILSHDKKSIRMDRLTSGAPLLFNHDRDAHIGRILSAKTDGHKINVTAKFSRGALGAEKMQDVEDGILKEASVGYIVHKYEVNEDDDTYTATDWEPLEGSLVTIPADSTVGIGRTEQNESPVEIVISEKTDSQKEKSFDKNENSSQKRESNSQSTEESNSMKRLPGLKFLAPDNGGNATGGTAVVDPPAETAEQRNARLKQEREGEKRRIREIEAIGKKGKVPADVIEKAIDDETSVDAFRSLVFEKYWGNAKPLETPGDGDSRSTSGGGTGKNGGQRMTVGAEFVRSESFTSAAKSRGQGERNASVEFPDVTMLGARGKLALATRAGFTSSDLSAINIQVLPGMVELGMQRLTIMDILAGGATDAAALPYAKENSFGSVEGVDVTAGTYPRAQAVGERGKKPLWIPDLTTDTANVKKIAVLTQVPDEFMADFAGMQSYIDNRLPYMVDLETEFQLLYGDGTGNNLKGIFTNSGIQTRAIDATTDTSVAASLKKGLTDISVGSQFEPTAYVFHPYDWETASLLKDTAGRFLAGGPYYIPYGNGVYVEMMTFWGKPVVVTTSCTYGRPLAGAWKIGAQYFVREGMRLETTNSNKDDFERNLVSIRAEHRLALATYRPPSFLEFTGFPART